MHTRPYESRISATSCRTDRWCDPVRRKTSSISRPSGGTTSRLIESVPRPLQKRLWRDPFIGGDFLFGRPRGADDRGAAGMAKRRFVESRFLQPAESFGLPEVSTPTFEGPDLFTAAPRPGLARLGSKDLATPLRKLIELSGDASVLNDAGKVLGDTAKEGLDYLRDLAGLLDDYGISRSDYAFDMGVVRGLDYYTGMVFEIDSPNLGAEKQVGGGGAYRLAEVFGGEPVAQTGFALGLDRLVMAAEAEGTLEAPRPLDAYIVPVGDTARKRAIQVLTSLRAAGLGADIDLVGRGPSKNLDYANAIGARFAVLLGERELKAGRATVREMATGAQREVALDDLVDAVRNV